MHYCPLVWSKIGQQVIKKERKIKAPVCKVLLLHTSHVPKLWSQVSWLFPVSRSLTSSMLGLPGVGYCSTTQMIYGAKLAQEAPVSPQQYSHLCSRPGRLRPGNMCYSRAWKAATAHKSLHQGRGLYQSNPFVSPVSDSQSSAIKAEILLPSTVIY